MMRHVEPEVLALLALDTRAGTDQDRHHLAGCADCHAELRLLTELVATAATIGPDTDFRMETPPASVWDRIEAELGPLELGISSREAKPGARFRTAASRAGATSRWSGWWRRPVVVATAGLLIGAAAAVAVEQLTGQQAPAPVVAKALLSPLPKFPQWRSASGTAVLRLSPAGRTLTVALRAPTRPGFFEVWLLGRNGVSMISLGDLDSEHVGQFTVPPGVDLTFYSRIDISLQPFDGSTLHSKVSVVRGPLSAG
jgi:anti-sigma-K factor RskA